MSYKVLHTADLHLNRVGDERWLALEQLVALGRKEGVQALAIAGNLFDSDLRAQELRPYLRRVFESAGFEVVILPGNHDGRAYQGGFYFGERVRVIARWDEPVNVQGVYFWGLPYRPLKREELFARLRELSRLMDREKSNLLLYHGELLDAFFSRYDFGDEGDERYMPCRLHYFDSLPVAYVLAGHFHNRFAVWPLKGGGCFVYPGSPVAVTRREKGCRKANLLVLGEPPRELVLDTLYYEEMELELDPFAEADPAALLQERLERLPPRAKVLLTVKGFINGSALKTGEAELVKTFKRLAGPRLAGEGEFLFRDIRQVLEDELFLEFRERLRQKDYPPEKSGAITELAIRAFMDVLLS